MRLLVRARAPQGARARRNFPLPKFPAPIAGPPASDPPYPYPYSDRPITQPDPAGKERPARLIGPAGRRGHATCCVVT
jgi:hypothetical protein